MQQVRRGITQFFCLLTDDHNCEQNEFNSSTTQQGINMLKILCYGVLGCRRFVCRRFLVTTGGGQRCC